MRIIPGPSARWNELLHLRDHLSARVHCDAVLDDVVVDETVPKLADGDEPCPSSKRLRAIQHLASDGVL
eukprot:CAMPEP_0196660718 /NCGR_PEP_ID=MMETSP1086-20130531/41062_1 /TAXON_ID=77921 /ORGANISM="Cyanoptyche  gloeocystis , Strain SAG4.97" /LENGTH=68 /DNA_ID=CAMNT_0041995283 /DNA_START=197 /DNA_END=400 /DNA_ORIENTATION=-